MTSQSQGEFQPKQDIAWYLYWHFSLVVQVSEHPPASHFSSCFHPISMTLLERTTGPTPKHPSNSTKVSQVSSTTGTPLHSILFHCFEAWSHKPLCQAPGLGSFIANIIESQVDVCNRVVDFQCFGKGLWTKTVANHAKPENLQGDLRH